jgi:hypothetical protein
VDYAVIEMQTVSIKNESEVAYPYINNTDAHKNNDILSSTKLYTKTNIFVILFLSTNYAILSTNHIFFYNTSAKINPVIPFFQ